MSSTLNGAPAGAACRCLTVTLVTWLKRYWTYTYPDTTATRAMATRITPVRSTQSSQVRLALACFGFFALAGSAWPQRRRRGLAAVRPGHRGRRIRCHGPGASRVGRAVGLRRPAVAAGGIDGTRCRARRPRSPDGGVGRGRGPAPTGPVGPPAGGSAPPDRVATRRIAGIAPPLGAVGASPAAVSAGHGVTLAIRARATGQGRRAAAQV